MFSYPKDTIMTPELLDELIRKHQKACRRYERLRKMYEGDHKILSNTKKPDYKPDNRLVANFAGYIVDMFNGFFLGIPIKRTLKDDEAANALMLEIDDRNDQDDSDAEISKNTSIYGHCFEVAYTNEESEPCTALMLPTEGFCVYDDTIDREMLFGVRYYNLQGKIEGSFSDTEQIVYFTGGFNGGIVFGDEQPHYFGEVPVVEYFENAERIGTFEKVETLINAFDKALSEKANDVDYFADAYLQILGVKLDEKALQTLREKRIINLEGEGADKIVVGFLEKPDSDDTQEHLIDRLERMIYQLAMVANITDENFGNASGVSLAYKLQSMNNMAASKERKFVKAMKKRYRLIMGLPGSRFTEDAWKQITFKFTRNLPNNVSEEVKTAGDLSGIVSKKTQLSVLSIVDDADEEIRLMQEEADGLPPGVELDRTPGQEGKPGAIEEAAE